MDIQDKTDEPRSDKELQEIIVSLKNNFITSKPTPAMIHYPAIWDSLYELLAFRKEQNIYKYLLKNLLAVIHRDGGHYTDAHGIEISLEDAMAMISKERSNLENSVCRYCGNPFDSPYHKHTTCGL